MNKPNVRKWVKALRSGKYKQTQSELQDGDSYCCLGVVCLLAGMKSRAKDNRLYFGKQADYLPKTAQRWLGVGDMDPKIGKFSASFLNDEDSLQFDEIADLVEKNWLSA